MKINTLYCKSFVQEDKAAILKKKAFAAYEQLLSGQGKGNEYLGWLDLPQNIEEEIILSMETEAKKIAQKAEIYVVIGIGGSYLGAKATIEALKSPFEEYKKKDTPRIIFAGHQLSEEYLAELVELLNHKEYALCVISKSGTTTEPAIAFRVLKKHLEEKYGKAEAKERIIAITDEKKGALKNLANQASYKSYIIPDNVGGRFSVLSPVGLLPIAVAGYDIRALLKGASDMEKTLKASPNNAALEYAFLRNYFYENGKKIEIMLNYNPRLSYFAEWFKQLFGESEGKDGKGIFPASVNNTSDLHSMGQYIQDGERLLFETVLYVQKAQKNLVIPPSEDNADGMNFVSGKSLSYVNEKAMEGTCLAHNEGKVPCILLEFPEINEYYLGNLFYFFEFSCGLSAYILGVNPFDQPGVEAYKKNMFRLLGKE